MPKTFSGTASAPAVITDSAILEEHELTEKRERLVAEHQRLEAEGTRLNSLVNPQSGRCQDHTGGNTADGTQLQIRDCSGGVAQAWYLP